MPPTGGFAKPSAPEVTDLDCDVTIKHPTLGAEIIHFLGLQGFCKVGTGFDTELVRQAVLEAEGLSGFQAPAQLLVDGLLGAEGSAEIMEMERPDELSYEMNAHPTLQQFDGFLSFIATQVDALLEDSLGIECGQRSLGLLHKSSKYSEEGPELTESAAGKWLSIFRRQKLMCLLFLGPKGGSVTLKPFDEDSDEEVVTLKCGQLMILRADALSHTYTSNTDTDMVLSCWLMTPDRSTNPTGGWVDSRESMVPAARAILEWSHKQLMLIKALHAQNAGTLEEMDIPRGWKLLASHTCYRGVQVALRGMATKLPNSNDSFGSLSSTLTCGVDFGTEWPLQRQAANQPFVYDPDPECWRTSRHKFNIKHGTFIDGQDLFDNKFFNMSVLEAKVTDPNQRLVLEGAYESLHQAGYVRKTLMQCFIGVYQGHTASDWDKIEHEQAGGFAGSYSPTIASNRVNFSLGIMGPSFTIDVEGASSGASIYQACHDVLPTEDWRKPLVAAGLAGGVTLQLSHFWWPVHNQFMSMIGRCLTFDQSASGYIKGEGCCQAVFKRHGDLIEGEVVTDDSRPNISIAAGFAMSNSGAGASLTAPSGPAMMRCVAECIRNAQISPLDVDAIEIDGKANFLHDATEVSCVSKVLRGLPGGEDEVLAFLSHKTKLGYCQETAGIAAFFSLITYQSMGFTPGNIHCKALNPHVEMQDSAAIIPTDMLGFRCRSSFVGFSSYGFGGTNTHLTSWGEQGDTRPPDVKPTLEKQVFAFWPGGGGEMEEDMTAAKGYFILGSWSSWQTPEKMRPEGEGAFGFNVTLGENRFESFQVLIDGDKDKVLHPGMEGGWANSSILGPSEGEEAMDSHWLIDGRTVLVPAAIEAATAAENQLALTEGGGAGAKGTELEVPGYNKSFEWTEAGSRFSGLPGDQYHVSLKIAGKWRTVTWDKITTDEDRDPSAVTKGTYYIISSWNNWTLEQMTPSAGGIFTYEYQIPKDSWAAYCSFNVLRNNDVTQIFYPGEGDEVWGPDPNELGFSWDFKGVPGSVVKIEFQRNVEGEDDVRKVSWQLVPAVTA